METFALLFPSLSHTLQALSHNRGQACLVIKEEPQRDFLWTGLWELSPLGKLWSGCMYETTVNVTGHLIQKADSLDKMLFLGKIEGRRRRGQQRMRWWDRVTNSMDISLSKLRRWWTGKPGVLQSMVITESQIQLSNWRTTVRLPMVNPKLLLSPISIVEKLSWTRITQKGAQSSSNTLHFFTSMTDCSILLRVNCSLIPNITHVFLLPMCN